LTRPGALTAGLRHLGALDLRVLAEYPSGAPADEAAAMGLLPAAPVWVREIVMSLDGVDCVAARSLAALPDSHGVWQGMRRLRTRPLADMLYHDARVTRSPFEFLHALPHTCVAPVGRMALRHDRHHAVGAAGSTEATLESSRHACGQDIWVRRSVFRRDGRPLLVAEAFLPAFAGFARCAGRT
jgi:chorismate--pyruvate lyase